MKQSTVDQIVTAAESLGLEVEAVPDYSGRGMYGKTTAGISITDAREFGAFAAAVGEAVRNSDDPDDLIDEVRKVRTDSMGRYIIIY